MIRVERRGPDSDSFRGVWRLVEDGIVVTDEVFFDWRRAQKALHKRRQTTLDL